MHWRLLPTIAKTTCSNFRSCQQKLLFHRLQNHGNARYSVSLTNKSKQLRGVEVSEYSVTNLNHKDTEDVVIHTLRGSDIGGKIKWDVVRGEKETGNKTSLQSRLQAIPEKAISLLLPANYPQSVSEGYFGFVSFCFTASIAGSAAMVLSTQTLLLAVGIVAQGSTSTSVMAGALNWIMKDFIGQLGGIIFASQMGKTKAFDNDPKRWRMVSAIALDGATMLEILSPLCLQSLVLPVASVANIGKNIGFLTASASRAALHQSLAISGNLGDVTVKAGSQSMTASLLGTSLGISLSTLLQHDTLNFGICFLCLSAIHQGCTYQSLQNVPLAHFNRHRLYLAMEYYLKNLKVPSPVDVGKIERFFPVVSSDTSLEWLRIGRPLKDICPTPIELENCLKSAPNESYIIRLDEKTHDIDLTFLKNAKERDLYRGIYHACLLRYEICQTDEGHSQSTVLFSRECNSKQEHFTSRDACETITRQVHTRVQKDFEVLFEQFHTQGWSISSGLTDIEGKKAHRIQISAI